MVGFANPAADQLLTGLRKAAAQEEASRRVTDRLIRSSQRRRLLCTVSQAALQAGGCVMGGTIVAGNPIAARLRENARIAALAGWATYLLHEAADEIDRLETEAARLRLQAEDRAYE